MIPEADTPRADTYSGIRWVARIAWGLAGIMAFFWIGAEDVGIGRVMPLAALLGAGLGLKMIQHGARGQAWPAVAGILSGAAVPLIAVVLMLVKVSLHAHPNADFALADFQSALRVTPVWALVGLLAGASLKVWDYARER
ncbi:MAG: hypothetical protein WD040_05120 [Anaerolineales bacterium]